jgi:hypothetical protein
LVFPARQQCEYGADRCRVALHAVASERDSAHLTSTRS